jgi:hypothetical protein
MDKVTQTLMKLLKGGAKVGAKGASLGVKGAGLLNEGTSAVRGGMAALDDKVLSKGVKRLADLLRAARGKSANLMKLSQMPEVDELLLALKRLNTPQVRKGVVAGGLGLGGLSALDSLTSEPEYEDYYGSQTQQLY